MSGNEKKVNFKPSYKNNNNKYIYIYLKKRKKRMALLRQTIEEFNEK